MNKPNESQKDPYVDRFLSSPAYIMVFKDTIKTAASSYKVARILSVILFIVGILLLGTAVIFGLLRNEQTLSLIFGGLGTANLFALLLYRPIERIQAGVDTLIKSQIACLSFVAQYDSIVRTLSTLPEVNKDSNFDNQLKLTQYLKDSASQLIDDLNNTNRSKPTKQSSEK